MIFIGTLPGRKPGTFTCLDSRCNCLVISLSTRSAGSEMVIFLSILPDCSTLTCMLILSLVTQYLVRKGRLELPRVTPLEPKSSASTNSATLANKVPHTCCRKTTLASAVTIKQPRDSSVLHEKNNPHCNIWRFRKANCQISVRRPFSVATTRLPVPV